jgi:DNA primase
MTIPSAFLDDLRARISLADVIGKRVRLTRRGRDFLGLCPFHQEKTPSFTVFDDHYHCFGCGAHGSVFDFVMHTEGLGFREAIERLAAEAGVAVPTDRPEQREAASRRRGLHEVVDAATSYYEKMLRMPVGRDALAYLHRRGVSEDLIGRFRLGYAPDTRGGLRTELTRAGFDEKLIIEAGLLIKPEADGRAAYDRFRGRVMFPIADRQGRMVAFGGRVLGAGEPKYLNSPETPLFHKSRMLYGLAEAAKAARAAGTLIVAEGYMDVIALVGAGWGNAVAPLGTALTVEQIGELWRAVPEPIVLFDPDAAGQRAAMRAAERVLPLLKPGYGLRFAFIETATGDDPDGVTRRYPRDFITRALSASLTLADVLYWAAAAGKLVDTPEKKARIQKHLEDQIAHVPDRSMRAYFMADFKKRLWDRGGRDQRGGRGRNVAGTARRGATRIATPPTGRGAGAGTQAGAAVPVAETPQRHQTALRQREAILLAVLVNTPDAFDIVGERLGFLSFSDPELDNLRQAILNAMGSDPGLDSECLESHLRNLGHSSALDSIMSAWTFEHAFFSRRGTALEIAVEGWEETYTFYRRERIRAEINAEKRDLARCIEGECRRSEVQAGAGDLLGTGAQGGGRAAAQRYGYFEALKNQEHNQEQDRESRANEGVRRKPINPGSRGPETNDQ